MAFSHTYFPSSYFPGRYFSPLEDAEQGVAVLAAEPANGTPIGLLWTDIYQQEPGPETHADDDAFIATALLLSR